MSIFADIKREGFKNYIIEKLFHPRWIVSLNDDANELGFRIMGINFWYYKWPDPMISPKRQWRVIEKREFGEVIRRPE
jgi:hypothetical protein